MSRRRHKTDRRGGDPTITHRARDWKGANKRKEEKGEGCLSISIVYTILFPCNSRPCLYDTAIDFVCFPLDSRSCFHPVVKRLGNDNVKLVGYTKRVYMRRARRGEGKGGKRNKCECPFPTIPAHRWRPDPGYTWASTFMAT